jgi:hypothetical protein
LVAYFLATYRYRGRVRAETEKPMLLSEATLTSFFTQDQSPVPAMRSSRRWNPV